ncbi:MAG: calcium-binding protein [Pseudomonadota bacterium]
MTLWQRIGGRSVEAALAYLEPFFAAPGTPARNAVEYMGFSFDRTKIDLPFLNDVIRLVQRLDLKAEAPFAAHRQGSDASDDQMAGGAAREILRGLAGDDTITGGDGDDRLFGDKGDDHLHGGRGNDGLIAGAGHDTVVGADGNDWIRGRSGHDRLSGGDGNDRIKGDAGDDTVIGGDGFYDKLYGGRGDDLVIGAGGADWMFGGSGDDTLRGGAGHDRSMGGAGADVIVDRAGSDWLSGQDGDDILVAHSDAGRPTMLASDAAIRPDGRWDDLLTGGAGADSFHFIYEMNAGEEVARRNADASGAVDWMQVMGENANRHDHWVDWGGIDRITDYDRREGDLIIIEGHTVAIHEIRHLDQNRDGRVDASAIVVVSDQEAMMGGAEAPMAHDGDLLGMIVVDGVTDLRPDEIVLRPMSMEAAFDNVFQVFG